MPHSFTIPPGGHIGFSQMMPASRWALLGYGSGSGGTRRGTSKRRRKKASGKRRSAKRAKSTKRKSRMKFGSPAWQKKYKVGRFNKKRRK